MIKALGMIGVLARHDPAATATGVRLAALDGNLADSDRERDEQDARKSVLLILFHCIEACALPTEYASRLRRVHPTSTPSRPRGEHRRAKDLCR